MTSPFVFNVAELLRRGAGNVPEHRRQAGPSPSRIGTEMIAIAEGEQVTVDATLTMLGSGVLVDADVTTQLTGQCVRCLRELTPDLGIHINQVFAADDDFVSGDEADDDGGGDDIPAIVGDELDLEQTVVDEVGLNLPFNPTCEGGCPEDETDVPPPDGVSGDEGGDDRIDPRWAGLEKFL